MGNAEAYPVPWRGIDGQCLVLSVVGHAFLLSLLAVFYREAKFVETQPLSAPPMDVYLLFPAEPVLHPEKPPDEPPDQPVDESPEIHVPAPDPTNLESVEKRQTPSEAKAAPPKVEAEQSKLAQGGQEVDWWSAAAEALKNADDGGSEFRAFGTFPERKSLDVGDQDSVPSIFQTPTLRKGTFQRNVMGQLVYWVSEECFLTLEASSLLTPIVDQFHMAMVRCRMKSRRPRSDLFESLVRE